MLVQPAAARYFANNGMASPMISHYAMMEYDGATLPQMTPGFASRLSRTHSLAHTISAAPRASLPRDVLMCSGCDGHIPANAYADHIEHCADSAPESNQIDWAKSVMQHLTQQWTQVEHRSHGVTKKRAVGNGNSTVQALLPLPPLLASPPIVQDRKELISHTVVNSNHNNHLFRSIPLSDNGDDESVSIADRPRRKDSQLPNHKVTSTSGRSAINYDEINVVCGCPLALYAHTTDSDHDSFEKATMDDTTMDKDKSTASDISISSTNTQLTNSANTNNNDSSDSSSSIISSKKSVRIDTYCMRLKHQCVIHLMWEELAKVRIEREYYRLSRRLEHLKNELETVNARLRERDHQRVKIEMLIESVVGDYLTAQAQREAAAVAAAAASSSPDSEDISQYQYDNDVYSQDQYLLTNNGYLPAYMVNDSASNSPQHTQQQYGQYAIPLVQTSSQQQQQDAMVHTDTQQQQYQGQVDGNGSAQSLFVNVGGPLSTTHTNGMTTPPAAVDGFEYAPSTAHTESAPSSSSSRSSDGANGHVQSVAYSAQVHSQPIIASPTRLQQSYVVDTAIPYATPVTAQTPNSVAASIAMHNIAHHYQTQMPHSVQYITQQTQAPVQAIYATNTFTPHFHQQQTQHPIQQQQQQQIQPDARVYHVVTSERVSPSPFVQQAIAISPSPLLTTSSSSTSSTDAPVLVTQNNVQSPTREQQELIASEVTGDGEHETITDAPAQQNDAIFADNTADQTNESALVTASVASALTNEDAPQEDLKQTAAVKVFHPPAPVRVNIITNVATPSPPSPVYLAINDEFIPTAFLRSCAATETDNTDSSNIRSEHTPNTAANAFVVSVNIVG